MKASSPVLRFSLHQAAVDAVKSAPPCPVKLTKAERREWRAALKTHYHQALHAALEESIPDFTWPNTYQLKIWRGILKRLQGQPSCVPPLFTKEKVMPCMRDWARQRGLI